MVLPGSRRYGEISSQSLCHPEARRFAGLIALIFGGPRDEHPNQLVGRAALRAALCHPNPRRVQRQSVQERLRHAGHLRHGDAYRFRSGRIGRDGRRRADRTLFSVLGFGRRAGRPVRARPALTDPQGGRADRGAGRSGGALCRQPRAVVSVAVHARCAGDAVEPGAVFAAAAASRPRRADRRQRVAGGWHVPVDPSRNDRRQSRRRGQRRNRARRPAACSLRGWRVCRQPLRAARAGTLARAAPQPQPGFRDRRDPAPCLRTAGCEAGNPRRVVVLARRRGVSVAAPQFRERDARCR